ncbi:MAG: pyridoxamine 5'-phosphate oxidase family protein [Acidimicrobiia bacterium]
MPRAERPAMRDYGVPDALDGVLPWSWAEQRLDACRNFWVVTASPDARPHAMPVWGIWLPGPDRFAFSCSPNARKARNLRANPRMTVAVDDSVECVSVEGRAHPLTGDDREPVIASYVEKYEPDPAKRAGQADFLRAHAMWAMVPERAFGIIEREEEFSARATRWVW